MRTFTCLLFLSTLMHAEDLATVRLTFYDGVEYFNPCEDECEVRLRFGDRDAGVEFDSERRQFVAPFGRYTLLVRFGGFRIYRRPIDLLEPKIDVLVDLRLGEIADYAVPPPPSRVEGRVITKRRDVSNFWVRVLPLFGARPEAFDSRVDDQGRFSVAVDNVTDFLILVLAPEGERSSEVHLQIVATKQVEVPWYTTKTVNVAVE